MENLSILTQATHSGGVLATIINVEGSSYRKPGAMMLFTEAGEQIGMISGSCLEADLEIHAKQLVDHPNEFSKVIIYDMSHEDDLGWGRGAGCNGKVHILLEELDSTLKKHLEIVLSYVTNHIPVQMHKSLRSVPDKIATRFYPENHSSFGADISYLTKEELYIQHIYPPKRLILFGANADAMPLIELAKRIGFETHVWDWRSSVLDKLRLQHVNYFTNMVDMTYYPSDYVVVMTHDFQYDEKILYNVILQHSFTYVGVLGPMKRMKRLLQNQAIPSWIHSPVGLHIQAEGPEEIAVSIMAEMIKVKNEEQSREQKGYRDLPSSGKKYKI